MFIFGVDVDALFEEATIVVVFETGAFEEEAVFETGAFEEEAVFETGAFDEEAVFETGAFEEEAVFETGAFEEEVSATDLELDAMLSVTSAFELIEDSGGSMDVLAVPIVIVEGLVVEVVEGLVVEVVVGFVVELVVSLAKAVLRMILAPNGSCN